MLRCITNQKSNKQIKKNQTSKYLKHKIRLRKKNIKAMTKRKNQKLFV